MSEFPFISYKEGKDGKKTFNDKIVKDFTEMGLNATILKGVINFGFEEPSKIQSIAILPLISSNPPDDLIGQARSGTGKTATFSISMLQNLSDESKDLEGIVLSPTRELALQIHRVFLALAQFTKFKFHCCVGGTKVQDDIDKLREGVNVVIGTVSRIMTLVKSNDLKVKNLKMLVIDDVDFMLTVGFKDQLCELFKSLNQNTQRCLFSDSMPPEVVELSEKFLRNPVKIFVKEKLDLEGIKQYYVELKKKSEKFQTLVDLYKSLNNTKTIIFAKGKKKVNELADKMKENNFTVSKFHSGLKDDREKVMKDFTTGSTRILISTTVVTDLVNGIDLGQVSLVINYDFPRQKEVYYTRISRTGTSINFITSKDIEKQKDFERYYQTKINPLPKDISSLL